MSAPLSYGYDKARDGATEALAIVQIGEVHTVLCSLTEADAQAVHDLINALEAELATARTRAETAEALRGCLSPSQRLGCVGSDGCEVSAKDFPAKAREVARFDPDISAQCLQGLSGFSLVPTRQ